MEGLHAAVSLEMYRTLYRKETVFDSLFLSYGAGWAWDSLQHDLLSLTFAIILRVIAVSANKNKNFFILRPFIRWESKSKFNF